MSNLHVPLLAQHGPQDWDDSIGVRALSFLWFITVHGIIIEYLSL